MPRANSSTRRPPAKKKRKVVVDSDSDSGDESGLDAAPGDIDFAALKKEMSELNDEFKSIHRLLKKQSKAQAKAVERRHKELIDAVDRLSSTDRKSRLLTERAAAAVKISIANTIRQWKAEAARRGGLRSSSPEIRKSQAQAQEWAAALTAQLPNVNDAEYEAVVAYVKGKYLESFRYLRGNLKKKEKSHRREIHEMTRLVADVSDDESSGDDSDEEGAKEMPSSSAAASAAAAASSSAAAAASYVSGVQEEDDEEEDPELLF